MLCNMDRTTVLKKDLFGEIRLCEGRGAKTIVRDAADARWWARPVARRLLRREAEALAALEGTDGVPALVDFDRDRLRRTYIDGQPLHIARPADPAYFRAASALLRRLHRSGVCHNDLAKEPNLLVREDGSPAFIDFQLAGWSRRRARWFRIAAREDIRHLLKHKRQYVPGCLTRRERRILASPSAISRVHALLVKPAYLFVTRRVLGWSDREGAADRGRPD